MGTDAYLDQWHWSEKQERAGTPKTCYKHSCAKPKRKATASSPRINNRDFLRQSATKSSSSAAATPAPKPHSPRRAWEPRPYS